MIKKTANRQILHFNADVCKLGLYVSCAGNLHYGKGEECDNRIIPDKVWIDDDGFIQVKVERRHI